MIITDKQYSLEKKMVEYVDRMALRVSTPAPKLDYALLVDGYEGYGKSNISCGIAYRIAEQTGRSFTLDNIFFDPEELIKFSTHNKDEIIMWDEMALVALAMERGNKWQLAIIQTLMMARKNRHFFIFCIPRFFRLKEAIIERCMGLVHVYARNQTQLGRFFFYKRSALEAMYESWKKTRRKPNYSRYTTVRGSFGECLPLIIDDVAYDKKKDVAIKQILERLQGKGGVKDKQKEQNENLKAVISILSKQPANKELILQMLPNTPETIRKWRSMHRIGAPVSEETELETLINTNG